jgi:hypothetical protein
VTISHKEYELISTLRARLTSDLSMLEHNSDRHNRASGVVKFLHSRIYKLTSKCDACSLLTFHTVDGDVIS